MKISQKQKEINRKKLIEIAVEVMIEKGFKSTTMRQIAKKAGIGDATIYNYFPTKESILFAYYEDAIDSAIEKMKRIKDFNQYSLHEQLNCFFEIQFEIFLKDREFVAMSFKMIFLSINQNFKNQKPIRDRFIEVIDDMIGASIDVKEIPPQVFQEMIYYLLWDFYIGMVIYWLNDSSERFTDTSLLLDKSLDIFCTVLKAGLVNKLVDITSYFFKNHLLNKMGQFNSQLKSFDFIKRGFMGNDTV